MKYIENPTKGHVERLKRKGCEFTSVALKAELEKQFVDLGIANDTLYIEPEKISENLPDKDPQTLHVEYRSLYDLNPYIADEVKIEVSVRSLKTPFTSRPVESILHEIFPNPAFAEIPFTVFTVEPRKTFLEKVFLLHEEFLKPDRSRIRSERMSRHLYDLANMIGTEIEQSALTDHALYDILVKHREWYSRISWVNYESLSSATINFLPPEEMIETYRKDYKTMQDQMIYGETLDFDALLENLKILQEKIRNKQ